MNRKSNNYIKLGAFVVVAFLLFIFAIYYVGSKQNLFGSTFTLTAEFDNVNGLQKGNNVLYNGITIGSVKDISIINDSMIRVYMIIDDKVKKHLKTNAIASINTSGLVGNMIVNIRPGIGQAPFVKDNTRLQTSKKKNTNEIIDDMGITALNLTALTQNLINITTKMDQGDGTIGLLLSDQQLANDLKMSIDLLKASSIQMNSTLKSINSLVQHVEDGKGNLGYLFKDNSLKNEITNISSDVDSILVLQVKPMMNHLSSSIDDINIITSELKVITNGLSQNDNIVKSMVADSTLARQLEQSVYNLENGTRKFQESMSAIQQSWIGKRLFKKEQ